MADLISDGAEFSCPFCPSKLKLTVTSSSSTGESKKLANKSNNFFPPPGGTCAITMAPCTPATVVANPGQCTVEIDNITALGKGCMFQCSIGGLITASSPGQTVAKHDEAASADDGDALEALSLALDLTPFAGSGKSFVEVFTGKDLVTGQETSRGAAAAGIVLGVVPGGKLLTKGKKATKVVKKALKGNKQEKAIAKVSQKTLPKAKYEAAPYHKKTDSGLKSRGPVNGQAALDNSIQVKPTSPRRIGIDSKNGDFVVFDKTSDNVFHGHVREWKDLHPDMQNALQKSGKVSGNGKIF